MHQTIYLVCFPEPRAFTCFCFSLPVFFKLPVILSVHRYLCLLPSRSRVIRVARQACAALRAAVDKGSRSLPDSVDGAPDHQLNLDRHALEQLIGADEVRDTSPPLPFNKPSRPRWRAPFCRLLYLFFCIILGTSPSRVGFLFCLLLCGTFAPCCVVGLPALPRRHRRTRSSSSRAATGSTSRASTASTSTGPVGAPAAVPAAIWPAVCYHEKGRQYISGGYFS